MSTLSTGRGNMNRRSVLSIMMLGLTALPNSPTMVDQGPIGRNLDARLLGARVPEWQQGPIVWHQSKGHRCFRREGPFLSHVRASRPSENRVQCSSDRDL